MIPKSLGVKAFEKQILLCRTTPASVSRTKTACGAMGMVCCGCMQALSKIDETLGRGHWNPRERLAICMVSWLCPSHRHGYPCTLYCPWASQWCYLVLEDEEEEGDQEHVTERLRQASTTQGIPPHVFIPGAATAKQSKCQSCRHFLHSTGLFPPTTSTVLVSCHVSKLVRWKLVQVCPQDVWMSVPCLNFPLVLHHFKTLSYVISLRLECS